MRMEGLNASAIDRSSWGEGESTKWQHGIMLLAVRGYVIGLYFMVCLWPRKP